MLCPEGEGDLDVSREGDTPAVGPVCAALLGDGGRLRKDFQVLRMPDGERKFLFFFGWLGMSGTGCKLWRLSVNVDSPNHDEVPAARTEASGGHHV